MSIKQTRRASEPSNIQRIPTRLSALALVALSTLAASVAMAASNPSDAKARYRADREACISGQSSQDRATCLKEAGAALKESRMGRLDDDERAYTQNALIRCNALPPEDRDACQRRIEGEGTISGSVREGVVVRELVVPDQD